MQRRWAPLCKVWTAHDPVTLTLYATCAVSDRVQHPWDSWMPSADSYLPSSLIALTHYNTDAWWQAGPGSVPSIKHSSGSSTSSCTIHYQLPQVMAAACARNGIKRSPGGAASAPAAPWERGQDNQAPVLAPEPKKTRPFACPRCCLHPHPTARPPHRTKHGECHQSHEGSPQPLTHRHHSDLRPTGTLQRAATPNWPTITPQHFCYLLTIRAPRPQGPSHHPTPYLFFKDPSPTCHQPCSSWDQPTHA